MRHVGLESERQISQNQARIARTGALYLLSRHDINERRFKFRKRLRQAVQRFVICPIIVVAFLFFGPDASAQDATGNPDPTSKNQVALPEQIAIDVPGKEISNELAAFSGAWSGDGWNGLIPTALVVEKINQDGSVEAIFAWGDIARTKRPRGWLRVTASIEQGGLNFSIPGYGIVEFNMTPDGRLFGRYTYPDGRREYSILARVATADRSHIIASSQNILSGEVVTFPVVSDVDPKQAAQLHGILYRSPIAGPRPIVVFSGDSASSQALRSRPNPAPIRARQILSLGYSMLVLQRKGMGGSDGAFMEPGDETISQRVQLQSALEDLHAAVTFVKQQDYVDASRIFVMGVYRGGLLSVAYAGLHDGAIAGVVNTWGSWRVSRNWWRKWFTWDDFTATQLANAGKKTKVPMLWIYGGADPSGIEYARGNFRAFTYQGGRGDFVDVSDDGKSGALSDRLVEKVDKAIVGYFQNLR